MNTLNEKTEETVKKIHLMVTNLCTRNCPNCCNKCYSLNDVPVVTDDELEQCETLFLTGGEPFEFCDVDALARYYKKHYLNIEKVIVYGNVREFAIYLDCKDLKYVDGVSLSIKTNFDLEYWNNFVYPLIKHSDKCKNLNFNRLYCFLDENSEINEVDRFPLIYRKWVDYKEWKPADDSIFRRAF